MKRGHLKKFELEAGSPCPVLALPPEPVGGWLACAMAAVISALAVATSFGMDAPHTASCLDCHQTHVLFGNQIGTALGNANECQSCHQRGGVAHGLPMAEDNQAQPWPGLPAGAVPSGKSHRWDSSPAGRVVGVGGSPAEALVQGGVYIGRYPKTYTVTISTQGDAGAALFNWVGTTPGGGSGTNLVTGSNVPIESGLALTFLNYRTNPPAFRVGDSWQVTVRPGLTPPANPEMASRTPGGTVVCSTCHDQHSQANEPFDPTAPPYTGSATSSGRHFMRVNNDQDQMCAECHGSRFVTNSAAGSHPVGVLVASNAYYRPPQSLPLDTTAGRVRCSTCHQVHQSVGNDGNILRMADTSQLCRQCHTLADTTTPASHLNPMTSSLWPGGQYGSLFPAVTDPKQRGGCPNCHRVHGWPDPSSATNDYPSLLVEHEENFCYTCHDGSPAAKNIRANFTKAYRHPVALDGLHTTTEDGIPARYGTTNRHSECTDCHNIHQLTPDYTTNAAAPYASAALKGVSRVSVNNVSATSVTYTYRGPSDPTPVKEYELCFVCHSSWTTQPAGQTNYAAVFNTKIPSFHPVEATALDTGINPGAFTNGWGPGMLVTCTDCHTSDDTTIRGPHGSANQWILKKPYVRANSPAHPSNGICFECHSASVYNTSGSSLSRFRGVDRPGHTHGGYNCYACHESHGSTTKPFLLGHSLTVYTKTSTGGTCDPSCHGAESYTVAYPR
jgi:predicted CXXCH cytochrome family protein